MCMASAAAVASSSSDAFAISMPVRSMISGLEIQQRLPDALRDLRLITAYGRCTNPGFPGCCAESRPVRWCRNSPSRYTTWTPGSSPRSIAIRGGTPCSFRAAGRRRAWQTDAGRNGFGDQLVQGADADTLEHGVDIPAVADPDGGRKTDDWTWWTGQWFCGAKVRNPGTGMTLVTRNHYFSNWKFAFFPWDRLSPLLIFLLLPLPYRPRGIHRSWSTVKTMIVKSVDLKDFTIAYGRWVKNRLCTIDPYRVFSISHADGTERVIYERDSLDPVDFSVNKCACSSGASRMPTDIIRTRPIKSRLFSLAAALYFTIYGLVIPPLYATIIGSFSPRIEKYQTDINLLNVSEYREGYERKARDRRSECIDRRHGRIL